MSFASLPVAGADRFIWTDWPLVSPKVLGGAGSGNYGHTGRPGVVGGSGPGTRDQARQALQDAVGKDIPVGVDDHPTAIRAAHEVADVVYEMRTKGYDMPEEIEVRAQPKEHPSGAAEDRGLLVINVPRSLPPEMSLDDAYTAAYGGKIAVVEDGELVGEVRKFSGETFRDLVVHEMGHINRRPMDYSETKASAEAFSEELKATKRFEGIARRSVSNYAATNPDEFVAETFTILYNGGKLPPDTMRVYDALRGAKIR